MQAEGLRTLPEGKEGQRHQCPWELFKMDPMSLAVCGSDDQACITISVGLFPHKILKNKFLDHTGLKMNI